MEVPELAVDIKRQAEAGSITPYGDPNGGRMMSTGSGPESVGEAAAETGVAGFETGAVEVAAGLMADVRLGEVPTWTRAAGLAPPQAAASSATAVNPRACASGRFTVLQACSPFGARIGHDQGMALRSPPPW